MLISRCCFAEDAKKCTKICYARAQPLFCSFNLLFRDVLVSVAVVVFFNSLLCGQGFESRRNLSILGFLSTIAKIVARLRGPWLYLISIRWANEIYFITTYTSRYDVCDAQKSIFREKNTFTQLNFLDILTLCLLRLR